MNPSLKDDIRYKNHETRPDLAGEHLLGDTYQLVAFFLFTAAHILDYLVFGFPQLFWGQAYFWLRVSGGIFLLPLGLWLSLYGIRIVFGEYSETPIFRKEGMFSVVRHPIYLGAILVYLAILLVTLSVAGGIVWVGTIGLYHWLAKFEEERMTQVFGEEYRTYQRQVPMWLPSLWMRSK